MKLNIVPARTGILWVRQGIQAFMKQPLALIGLFFIYMAFVPLVSWIPLVGPLIAIAIAPAATLGFMAATRETVNGKFPTPMVFVSAFRAGRDRLRAMLVLGGLYAGCVVLIMLLVGLLVDLPATPMKMDGKTMPPPEYFNAMMLVLAFYLPVSLMFWHAPALVHWHGVSPVKSLFFSTVACLRNFRALTLFGLTWFLLVVGAGVFITALGSIFGRQDVAGWVLAPFILLVPITFFTSLYFTFRDSFVAEPEPTEPPPGEPT
ncbi:BPSS1780 family membrane protein [Caenimonas sp. SL110]|uniref:BPSS1780 family membrane protein n=1 Tax=Caenimonas sp. SL110 TaxID=1450524 RepID=UPI00065384E4|nr:BPSS1780 family membrane protein [Caenimonas sp. SL110]